MKCEAIVEWKFKWSRHYTEAESQCINNASVKIDGINLCLIHAGGIAVRKLIGMKQAEVLPRSTSTNLCALDKF